MSYRYANAIVDPGLNTLIAPTPTYLPYLYSWGSNSQGQLGLGNQTNYSSPMQVGSLTNWASIDACNRVSFATKSDGTLWSWGDNGNGQLGLGNTTYYSSPKQIGSLTTWKSVAAGYAFGLAIKTDGTLWSWGNNNRGQLGLGTGSGSKSSPNQVGSLTNWLFVVSGSYHVSAIKTDGTLWAWGDNLYGQLGLGNTTYRSSPVQVGTLTNWLSAACGFYSTVAVKTDGTLWTWGYNGSGQLGLGNTTSYSSPKQVGALTNWSSTTACAFYSTFAIKANGTLWSWGTASQGVLGLGNLTQYSSPMQVGALTNWSKIKAGFYFALATKTDGTLWSWGGNSSGQLGLGAGSGNKSSPNQVGSLTTWLSVSCGGYNSLALQY